MLTTLLLVRSPVCSFFQQVVKSTPDTKRKKEEQPVSDPLSGGGGDPLSMASSDPLSAAASDPLSAVLMNPLAQASTSSFGAPAVKVGHVHMAFMEKSTCV